jgi:hypothetical protein
MKQGTKKILVAGGLAVGALALVSAIVMWPKSASAATKETGLPIALDVTLTDQEKKDVASMLYNQRDPAALAQAAYQYKDTAPIAAKVLAQQAISLIKPQLDAAVNVNDFDILLPLYIWNDPVEIQSAALVLQSKGLPKTADLIMQRALALSKLS